MRPRLQLMCFQYLPMRGQTHPGRRRPQQFSIEDEMQLGSEMDTTELAALMPPAMYCGKGCIVQCLHQCTSA